MKKLMIRRNKIQSVLSLLFAVIVFFATNSLVKADDITVTAVVPDSQAPSVPILISPADNAVLNYSTPSFQWYESSDNVAMSHYVLYLNGGVFYNNIPLITTENADYILSYDALNGIYTLTLKNSLSDQTYTWNIVAVDYANLSSSSDVWHFTIDTLAPNFVLQQIGDTTVDISAGNVNSVPSTPIVIFKNDATANEPTLIAYGEVNSEVKLTVTIPNDLTQTFTGQIDENGHYELKLGILPRDTDIRLDFIITDRVGHVSVLEAVYFRISLQYWPTSTPTPSSTISPTVRPSLTPIQSVSPTPSTSPSTSVSPRPSVSIISQPSGIVPIIPPKEIIHEAGDELIELLPESTADSVKSFLRSELWLNLAPLMGLLFLLGFYLLAFILFLSKFASDFSFALVKKLLLLLLPMFFKAKKNLVFEYRETSVSPLVKVELLNENSQVLDFTITNLQGNFDDFKTQGKWHLRVKDSNFYYPIGDQKPAQLEFWHFYQGQIMDENYHGQSILIPTLRASGQERLPFFERLRIFVLYLLDYPIWFLALAFLFNLIFLMRYAGLLNVIVMLFYVVILIYKIIFLNKKSKTMIIKVELENKKQLDDNLVVSLVSQENKLAQSLILPFEFSKSFLIKHSFSNVNLTVFAKNFALIKDEAIIDSQAIVLSQNHEEIFISLKTLEK